MRAVKRISLLFASTLLASTLFAGCEGDPPPPTKSSGTKPPVSAKSSSSATASASATPSASASGDGVLPALLFLPEVKTPDDNKLSEAKIALGKTLFFDKRLGKDGGMACEGCHFEDKGWADGLPLSKKADGTMNTRHTPSLLGVGYNESWYWDGRADTLEKQVLAAWKGQMGGDPDKAAAEIGKVEGYKKLFKDAFAKDDITGDDIVKALAAFVRSLRSGNSPFDKFQKGDKTAASEAAARGWELFRNKAGCAQCHAPPLYTDNQFHNVGVGYDKPEPDVGRSKVTNDDKDKGRFKTPTLRSITLHAPYFHDGSAKTLEEAVDYMLKGGRKNDNLDQALKPVELTPEERTDLLEFLKSLEGEKVPFEKPAIPE
jgi:cytochrome c peroxidase